MIVKPDLDIKKEYSQGEITQMLKMRSLKSAGTTALVIYLLISTIFTYLWLRTHTHELVRVFTVKANERPQADVSIKLDLNGEKNTSASTEAH